MRLTKERYIGWQYWRYYVPHIAKHMKGVVKITTPTGSYKEDEGFARYLVRHELGLQRLPAGSRVWPDYPPS